MARHGYIMETGSPQEAWEVAIKATICCYETIQEANQMV